MKQGKKSADAGSRIDRGWIKMQPRLALELPLEDKKDRQRVWLWVCFLGIAMGGLSVWLYTFDAPSDTLSSMASQASTHSNIDLNSTSQSHKTSTDHFPAPTEMTTKTKPINEYAKKNKRNGAQSQQINKPQDLKTQNAIIVKNESKNTRLIRKNKSVQRLAIHSKPDNQTKAIPHANTMPIPKAILSPTQEEEEEENTKTIISKIRNTAAIQNPQQISIAHLNPILIGLTRPNLLPKSPVLKNNMGLGLSPKENLAFNMKIGARALYTTTNKAKGIEVGLNPNWRKEKFGFGFSLGAGYEYLNHKLVTSALSDDTSGDMQENIPTSDTNTTTNAGVGFSSELMAYDRNTPPLEYVTTETIFRDSKHYALAALSLDYHLNNRMCISNLLGTTYYFDNSLGRLDNQQSLPGQKIYNYYQTQWTYFGEIRGHYNLANKLGLNLGFRYSLKATNQQYPSSITAGLNYRI